LYFFDSTYFRPHKEGDNAVPESKGHLNPGANGVHLDRFELGPGLSDLVRHVWVGRWAVPDGDVRPQRLLTYPALNAVIMPGLAALHGPDPRVQVQELRGTSWVVGILFRPAAGPLLTATDPVELVGSSEPLPAAPAGRLEQIMAGAGRNGGSGTGTGDSATRGRGDGASGDVGSAAGDRCDRDAGDWMDRDRAELVLVLRAWLRPAAADVDDRGRLVNEACRLAETDPALTRAADLAARLGVSPRSLERLVRAHIGLTPKWLIECRRLQHAATTLYGAPGTDLSALAADLGYTDYPHFFRQYQRVLGESPRTTRERGRDAEGPANRGAQPP
jgi:AraC-like DNA-binding protein